VNDFSLLLKPDKNENTCKISDGLLLSICIQYTSTARYPQPASLTVIWNNNHIIEGSANVTGQSLTASVHRPAVTTTKGGSRGRGLCPPSLACAIFFCAWLLVFRHTTQLTSNRFVNRIAEGVGITPPLPNPNLGSATLQLQV